MPGLRVLLSCVILLCLVAVRPAGATAIEQVTIAGGITAWLVREPAIPVISLNVSFAGGGVMDPPERKGAAHMVSGLLDEGAGELDALAFQTRLEELAIQMSFDAGPDRFTASLKTLSGNRDAAFGLLQLALTEPRFDEDAVERIRRQIVNGLIAEAKNPRTIASRTWFRLAFKDHPYGQPTKGTQESVKSITTDDLRRYVGKVLARERMLIGVVGDITAAELAPLLDRTFGGLPEQVQRPSVAVVAPDGAGRLEVVHQDIPQSQVIFGAAGIARDDPDWYAAYVLNYVLGGGGLTSRLSDQVRERRGLAYSVYSSLYPLDYAALHLGGVGTRNDSVAEALQVIRDELRQVRDNGISAEELRDAKTYINGSFPLSLTSGGRIAALLVAIQRNGLGIDYIDQRSELINAVTLDDVRRVAKRLLQPENLLVVVVGDPQGLDDGG